MFPAYWRTLCQCTMLNTSQMYARMICCFPICWLSRKIAWEILTAMSRVCLAQSLPSFRSCLCTGLVCSCYDRNSFKLLGTLLTEMVPLMQAATSLDVCLDFTVSFFANCKKQLETCFENFGSQIRLLVKGMPILPTSPHAEVSRIWTSRVPIRRTR